MIRHYKLNNLDEFKCLAGKCPDTCCAGWMIEIDEDSLEKYKKVEGNYSRVLQERIDYAEKVFRQKENGDCCFLCDNKLCDMYSVLGEGALCDTCRLYPRHIEEFKSVREMTLSLSCPEAARLLLSRSDKLLIEEVMPDKNFDAAICNDALTDEEGCENFDDDFEEFDGELYARLLETRKELTEVMQNRACSYGERAFKAVSVAIDLQDELDGFEPISEKANRLGSYELTKELFVCLKELEHLKKNRENELIRAEAVLYGKGVAEWNEIDNEFKVYCHEKGFNLEIIKEQLTVYYLYAYFCGAVYDDYVAAKVKGAVAHSVLINELWKAEWINSERSITFETMVRIVYEYARELENSNPNLIKMDELLDDILFC